MQVHYLKIIAIASLAYIVGANKNLNFDGVVGRLEKILCEINPKYGNITCKIKPKSRYDASMTVNITLVRTVTAFKYHSKGYYQFSNNEYRPMLLDIRVDYCAVEAGSITSAFQNVFRKLWGNRSNIFQHCPLQSGDYYLKDWNFVATDLPSVIPAGRYFVRTTFLAQSDESFFTTSIYFRIENHGILNLNVG